MSTTDEVRRDIERVRGDLGQTLEELGDRVAPAKVVARTKENVAEKVEEVKEKVSPARVARRQGDKLRDGFRHLMGFGDGSGGGYPAGQPGDDHGGRAGDAARPALGSFQDAPHAARQRAEGNPLAAGLLSFAAGFLLASILPPTEREQQLTDRLQEGFKPIAQEATEKGKQLAQELGQSARQSLEQVKDVATDATERIKAEATGTVEEVKSESTEAAFEIKERAQAAAGDIKDKATEAASQVQDEAASDSEAEAAPPPATVPARRPRPLRAPRIYG
ncbi:MAG TPA: DUF3618 domain-containing protein [Acidimicrobiales bacterium]|jgi:gas vesicle protein|nr:DUF3618 domain-containing protein [Acidimicrobiales bacterium]